MNLKLSNKISPNVLIAVLKNPKDLEILLNEHWYRIPLVFMPKRPFEYIAFYQPAIFGKQGKRIQYYARIKNKQKVTRIELLPDEPNHPRAQDVYYKFTFDKIKKLAKPIKNIIPRRVSFGFVSLKNLLTARNILELYDVPPTEQIIARGLSQRGITATPEYPIGYSSGRFRLDIAVICRNGNLAIECDNTKAHRGKTQQKIDQHKNFVLKHHGWRLIRLDEDDVLNHFDRSMARLETAIASLGGQSKITEITKD